MHKKPSLNDPKNVCQHSAGRLKNSYKMKPSVLPLLMPCSSLVRGVRVVGLASSHELRAVLTKPFLEVGVGLKFRHLDTVDGWPFLAHLPDFLSGHLADPKHAMPLQAGMGEIDRTLIKRPVEVAAPDQDEVHEVPGEFQQQPIGWVVLPVSQPGVGEPDAVAIAADWSRSPRR